MSDFTLDDAIEVFVRGFAFTRSRTYPFVAERVEQGVWVMRDAVRARGEYRREEYVAHDVEPAAIDTVARRHTRGRFCICAIRAAGESDIGLRAGFKALGYRLMATEAIMVHRLKLINEFEGPLPIVRISTPAQADSLAKAAGKRQILHEHLLADPAPMRQYMATDSGVPVGWVGSVAAAGCAWCTNMFVAPEYRRRGIAKALMTRMLLDDRAAGAKVNALTASHAGSKLYPILGYEQIGELLAFTPPRLRDSTELPVGC